MVKTILKSKLFYTLNAILLTLTTLPCQADSVDNLIKTSLNAVKHASEPTAQCRMINREEAILLNINLPQKNQFLVKIDTQGFSPGMCYTFYKVNTLLNKAKLGDCIADIEGKLVFAQDRYPLKDCCFSMSQYLNGEPVYYAFVSEDKKTCTIASIVPDPIEYEWKDGTYISLAILDKEATFFSLEGKGFKPNEPVLLTSTSSDETIRSEFEASENGTFSSLFAPAVIGKNGGSAAITITRKHTDETGTLSYLWGCDAIEKAK